jgi:hypothetical protein
MVLAIGHALRAHEALGRPYTLPGFLEIIHRLFEDGVLVGHDRSIRVDSILPGIDGPGYPLGMSRPTPMFTRRVPLLANVSLLRPC